MSRQALLQKLDEVLGPKDAWALMEEVSGRDRADLATKVDLHHLGALTKRDIEAMEGRMEERFKGFEGMDERFKGLESRMEARFQVVDARFEAVEERIVHVEVVLSGRSTVSAAASRGPWAGSSGTCTRSWLPTPAPRCSPASWPS